MSYILEALRRAESERGRRRGVPGLHTQPVPAPSPDDGERRKGRPWLWVVSGLSAGVLLMLLWRSFDSEPLVDEAALARAPVAGSVTPQATAASSPAAVAAAPVASAVAPAAAPAATGTAAPAPATRAPRANRPARKVAAPEPPPARAPTPSAAPTPARPPAAAEPRLRSLAELPDDLRRAVPALAFGGSVYSETPAQRMVIFNGQVVREGDSLGDEVMLEQIRPRSAVLRVRGERFEVTF